MSRKGRRLSWAGTCFRRRGLLAPNLIQRGLSRGLGSREMALTKGTRRLSKGRRKLLLIF